MAKIGDTVRYLNSVGGGKIVRIEGNMAYVDDDGFETPVLVKELVVVLPAGHEPSNKNASLMFDQKAFDNGRRKEPEPRAEEPRAEEVQLPPAPETAHGDRLNIALAFEPSNLKSLDSSSFNAVLVNDSNYTLLFSFAGRSADMHAYKTIFSGKVLPNELIDLAQFTHQSLGEIERISLQAIAFKHDREFEAKLPVNFSRRLDLTKFHKLHCFRPGVYFDSPVLEIPVVSGDSLKMPVDEYDVKALADKYARSADSAKGKKAGREKGDTPSKKRQADPASNPHKLLPPIEVDLHIAELVDSIAGLSPADMLELQVDTARKTMKENAKRIGQKIIFIHGKGNGTLRKELSKMLGKEYPSATVQDASFREYGFGAMLVTVKTAPNK